MSQKAAVYIKMPDELPPDPAKPKSNGCSGRKMLLQFG